MKPTLFFGIISFILPTTLIAQDWNFTQKIVASDRSMVDQFGQSVAISGNYAIIGAIGDDTDANDMNFINSAGSVYFFEKNTMGDWIEIQKVVPSDRLIANELFGSSVGISGNTAIVGKFDSNSAYIFERDSNGVWQEVQIINATSNLTSNTFGRNVAIDGNYILVGSQDERVGDNTTPNTGAVYIYERNSNGNWVEIQRLLASDGESGDDFGEAVAISGDYIVVGALLEDEGQVASTNEGAAYIFKRNSLGIWEETQKIVNPQERREDDLFANEVAMDTNYLVLGNFGDDTDENGMNPGFNNGAAFVYELNSQGEWIFVKKLVASDRSSSSSFADSVSISGNTIGIGAWGVNSFAGAVYVFQLDQNSIWTEQQRIIAPQRAANDVFGRSVAVEGDTCLVGASKEDQDSMEFNYIDDAGAAYFFEYNGSLSVNDVSASNNIEIYPNPTSKSIYFSTNNTPIQEVQLYNLQGRLIQTFKSEVISEINIDNISKGLYVVKAISDKGTQTFKVIKE